jgi:two-component system response regulator YesN
MFKVVIVEDEDLIRNGLAYTFDWLTYDCVVVGGACNGCEAIELINKHKPDIVITDIKMPIMDGLEMLGSFKVRDFETIIITGYAEFDYAKKAIQYEVSEFLLKPINHDQLAKIIVKLTSKVKEKLIVKSIQDKIKAYSDLALVDIEYYYQDTNYKSRYTPKVLNYIEKNYSDKISIDTIADKLEVSSTYLSKKFKEDTKHTFNDFLNKYRIQKALEYMSNSDMKIYEIAEKVGYSEYKYFSTVFKNYLHYSPSKFMQSELYIKIKE